MSGGVPGSERPATAAGTGWAWPRSGVVVGVDPGSIKTGFGAIRRDGPDLLWVDSGRLRPPRTLSLIQRLGWLHDAFGAILDRLQPAAVAIETSFVGRNLRSALILGQARGALICAATARGRQVLEFSPAEIKLAVVGHGGASKRQVQGMVARLLAGLRHDLAEDEADALAVGLCCMNRRTSEEWRDLASARDAG